MKKGANPKDQKLIAHYAEQGGTAEQISKHLRIELSCVQSFMPEKAKEAVKKTKARNKKEQAKHDAIMAAKTTPAIDPSAPVPESE